ncbi:bacterial proteasome activator family protein [Frankia sp. CcWB2]
MTDQPEPRVMVVGPDGALHETADSGVLNRPVRPLAPGGDQALQAAEDPDGGNPIAALVSQPDKVMRIGAMIKQLLEEVRAAPLDDASRVRLREIHRSSIQELSDGLAPDLHSELDRLSLPFDEERTPSDAELRIAQAQLVGWLEGLFHGLQTALFAQQMAAKAQLEEMRRRALPSGQQPGSETFGRGAYL